MTIIAATVAHNEPEWVRALTFGGVPVITETRARPDVVALCDDGTQLWVERKTADDFLNSLRDEGNLFLQCAALSMERTKNGAWPYVILTGHIRPTADGMTETERGKTGWNWAAVQGALLTIQEFGVFVAFANGDADFESAVMRLANRARKHGLDILPARMPAILPREFAVLADIGIHPERAKPLLRHCGTLEVTLMALCDPTSDLPGITQRDRAKAIDTLQSLRDR